MKYNLKNELWKSNPHDAKIAFEKELRDRLDIEKVEVKRLQADDDEFTCFEDDHEDLVYGGEAIGKRDLLREILGES